MPAPVAGNGWWNPPGTMSDNSGNTTNQYIQVQNGGLVVSPLGSGANTGALVTLAASGTSGNSADQASNGARGINVGINITALTGTSPTLTVTIQGKDTASGVYYNILASTAIAATGFTLLQVYPGLTAAANSVANNVLPATWRILYTIGGTTPAVTATIGASLIP